MLVDSTGNIDIVEIETTIENCIVTNSMYRDNDIPCASYLGQSRKLKNISLT